MQCGDSLLDLEILNLNGCQRISDKGIEVVTNTCPKLKVFSIYWNVRYLKLHLMLSPNYDIAVALLNRFNFVTCNFLINV